MVELTAKDAMEEYLRDGSTYACSSVLDLGAEIIQNPDGSVALNEPQIVALRFETSAITPRSRILSSSIRFVNSQFTTYVAPVLNIFGEVSDRFF